MWEAGKQLGVNIAEYMLWLKLLGVNIAEYMLWLKQLGVNIGVYVVTETIRGEHWSVCCDWNNYGCILKYIQSAYKLSEYFAKTIFSQNWTEIHDVTTIWQSNVCSYIVTLNAFDVRPTCDTADVQVILPFPPNPLKHVLYDIPDRGVNALLQFW